MTPSAVEKPGLIDACANRRALAGFFLSGALMAFLGAILPAWRHHVTSDYLVAGRYFLCFSVGMVAAAELARRILDRAGLRFILALSSAIASGSFAFLALDPPPLDPAWRMAALLLVGLASGGLNTGLCHAAAPLYRRDSAATLNLAGIFFNAGCISLVLLVAGTFYVYTVPSILLLLAVVPGFLAVSYGRTRWDLPLEAREPTFREALRDFKSFGAVLLALLAFFQFGNEWATAGWLPTFLIQRIGMSPSASLLFLAIYWLTLLVGRVASNFLLPRVRHGRLLFAGALASIFGCAILLSTDNQFGVLAGVLLVAGGFAPVYPLISAKIGDRYHYYRPGFFNGIFSFAIIGGMVAPWSLGIFCHLWDVSVVMWLPLIGTIVVVIISLLLWLEARLRG